jgi:hypothetical protein
MRGDTMMTELDAWNEKLEYELFETIEEDDDE